MAYDAATGNWSAFALDAAGLLLPGVTGLGHMDDLGRATSHLDDLDNLRYLDNLDDARWLDNTDDFRHIDYQIGFPSMGHKGYYGDIGPIRVDLIPESEMVNFRGGHAFPETYSEGQTLFRVSSPGRELKNWWTTEPPRGELQWRIDQAVPPAWGNSAEKVSIMTIPPGENLSGWSGPAGYQGGIYVGGGNQVYLPRVPETWVQSYDFSEFLKLWSGP